MTAYAQRPAAELIEFDSMEEAAKNVKLALPREIAEEYARVGDERRRHGGR